MSKYIGTPVVNISADTVDVTGDITTTDATPEVIIVNNTHEDTDGGREGKVTFKGQQSGGEETTLAQIQASHDGTSDDEKGDLIFKTNDGSDGASPTEAMRIDSAQNIITSKTVDINTASRTLPVLKFTHTNSGFDNFQIGGGTPGVSNAGFTIRDVDASANRIVINSDGDVGIGTAAPARNFHLHESASSQPVVFAMSTNGTGATTGDGFNISIDGSSGAVNVIQRENAAMQFYTNGGANERMRIISQGALQVSDTGVYDTWGSNITSNQIRASHTGLVTLTVDAFNTSFANDVMRVLCDRSGSTSFDFMVCTSGDLADDQFKLRGDGNAFADGSFTGGGADYAEYFEWADGNTDNEDRVGFSVVLDNNKIRKATSSDDAANIIGVVSANPSVVGDGDMDAWKHKYLRDDFGRFITDAHNVVEWTETVTENEETKEVKHTYEDWNIPDDVTVPSDATILDKDENGNVFNHKRLNPDYDPDKAYVRREDRPEWVTVGMMGKLRMRKGQPTGDRWIKMRDVSDTVEEWLVR